MFESNVPLDYTCVYVIAGVSIKNKPIVSTMWHSVGSCSDKIIEYLKNETEFCLEKESNKLGQIWNFVPRYYDTPVYPSNEDRSEIFIKKIEKELPVIVNRDEAHQYHGDITLLQSYSVLHQVHEIFLLRVNDDGLLEWKTCCPRFTWRNV